jgi:hypothetical protein
MRADYSVLTRDIGLNSALDDLIEEFIDGGHDGIYVRIPQGVELEHLDILAQLPGLKYVEVNGAVRDDSHAFSLPGVTELVLLTRSQVPLRAPVSDSLELLAIDDRPGVLDLSGFRRLQGLTIWSYARDDLRFLSGAPNLQRLKLEGLGQVVNLSGIASCRSLVDAELLEIQAESLAPLRSLGNLMRLWLIGPTESSTPSVLSLDDLSAMRFLRELRITNSGVVQSAEPLLRLSELRDIRLRGTAVLDPSTEVLQILSRRARVVGPDE